MVSVCFIYRFRFYLQGVIKRYLNLLYGSNCNKRVGHGEIQVENKRLIINCIVWLR